MPKKLDQLSSLEKSAAPPDVESDTFATDDEFTGINDYTSDGRSGEFTYESEAELTNMEEPTRLSKTVKPLTPEALVAFQAAQDRAGIIYISRIPPGMRPTKVRHLMSQHGELGRVYLQQEDAKRAYLRRKHTSTKKPHFTEGWVEFKDKKVARAVAEMLNARPIGGKKGTRWRDDVWTMKYLPKFKWNMLTEQIAHEAAVHRARLRVELEQSKKEQRDYLKNVELARVLDKRAERKRAAGKTADTTSNGGVEHSRSGQERKREGAQIGSDSHEKTSRKRPRLETAPDPVAQHQLNDIISSLF